MATQHDPADGMRLMGQQLAIAQNLLGESMKQRYTDYRQILDWILEELDLLNLEWMLPITHQGVERLQAMPDADPGQLEAEQYALAVLRTLLDAKRNLMRARQAQVARETGSGLIVPGG